ncbi:hypothetical protein BD777DRAFT_131788 [Yarrowia lipolytica]|nr:hypothetical protein BD777DRAFT_131788 [Yarrowia lipolytica]
MFTPGGIFKSRISSNTMSHHISAAKTTSGMQFDADGLNERFVTRLGITHYTTSNPTGKPKLILTSRYSKRIMPDLTTYPLRSGPIPIL